MIHVYMHDIQLDFELRHRYEIKKKKKNKHFMIQISLWAATENHKALLNLSNDPNSL